MTAGKDRPARLHSPVIFQVINMTNQKPLIVEATTPDQVNKLEEEGYRFERFSESRDRYIMVRRRDA